jgi:hypothetical protein
VIDSPSIGSALDQAPPGRWSHNLCQEITRRIVRSGVTFGESRGYMFLGRCARLRALCPNWRPDRPSRRRRPLLRVGGRGGAFCPSPIRVRLARCEGSPAAVGTDRRYRCSDPLDTLVSSRRFRCGRLALICAKRTRPAGRFQSSSAPRVPLSLEASSDKSNRDEGLRGTM